MVHRFPYLALEITPYLLYSALYLPSFYLSIKLLGVKFMLCVVPLKIGTMEWKSCINGTSFCLCAAFSLTS